MINPERSAEIDAISQRLKKLWESFVDRPTSQKIAMINTTMQDYQTLFINYMAEMRDHLRDHLPKS
jgi:hypothetical protein